MYEDGLAAQQQKHLVLLGSHARALTGAENHGDRAPSLAVLLPWHSCALLPAG
jgi:hypothetical protein